jgi:UDP-N-acetylmuramate-alanine ligase
MQGARQIYKNQKSLLIFEPHTYMRLNTFYNDFMKILTTQADGILICPVFKARSESTARQRSHYDIYSDLKKNGVMVEIINSFAELKSVLERLESKYDFAIAFTAGELDYHLRSLMLPSRRQIVD